VPSKTAPKPTSPGYGKKLELYERLVASIPKVERKGDTMPYTSVNGNMFSLLTRSGTLALRLPAKEREAFLQSYGTKLTEQYGVVMKEYVDVPDALLADTRALAKFFDASYVYASGLRVKATTKQKKAVVKTGASGKQAAHKKGPGRRKAH
jgi:hypothetical protein